MSSQTPLQIEKHLPCGALLPADADERQVAHFLSAGLIEPVDDELSPAA